MASGHWSRWMQWPAPGTWTTRPADHRRSVSAATLSVTIAPSAGAPVTRTPGRSRRPNTPRQSYAVEQAEMIRDRWIDGGLGVGPRVSLHRVPFGMHGSCSFMPRIGPERAPVGNLGARARLPNVISDDRDVQRRILQHQAADEIGAIDRDHGRRDRPHRVSEENRVPDAECVQDPGHVTREDRHGEPAIADAAGSSVTAGVRDEEIELVCPGVGHPRPARAIVREAVKQHQWASPVAGTHVGEASPVRLDGSGAHRFDRFHRETR